MFIETFYTGWATMKTNTSGIPPHLLVTLCFRFNVPGIGDIHLDAVDRSSYDIILKATNDYLSDEKYYDIKRLVKKLSYRIRR